MASLTQFSLICSFLSLFSTISVLGCPIARKRRLEEAEAEQESERPASKRKSHPLKLALDEGFSTESDASSEADGEGEKAGETKEEEKEERETAAEEEKEELTDNPTQNGHMNGQDMEPHSQQKEEEEEEDTYQKEDNVFTAHEGALEISLHLSLFIFILWSSQ